jgi:hypothetical protein
MGDFCMVPQKNVMPVQGIPFCPSELPQAEKAKDIRTIKAIPAILGQAGLRIVRLLQGFNALHCDHGEVLGTGAV